MIKQLKSQHGAAALVGAIIVATALFSISLSVLFISLNMKESLNVFIQSTQSFYAAESGVGEALMQLRTEPNNYDFRDIQVGEITATSEFFDMPGECQPIPECQFVPAYWPDEDLRDGQNHRHRPRTRRYRCGRNYRLRY